MIRALRDRRGTVARAGAVAAAVALAGMLTSCSAGKRPAALHDVQMAPGRQAGDALFIYARQEPEGRGAHWQVGWSRGEAPAQRLDFPATAVIYGYLDIPGRFGFLPSPDGQHLLVWATEGDERGAQGTQVWRVVNLSSGTRRDIFRAGAANGVFPYWSDDHRISFEKGGAVASYDVRADSLAGELPRRTGRDLYLARDVDDDETAQEWRQTYLDQHFSQDSAAVTRALDRGGEELAVGSYLRARTFPSSDTQAEMMLRPMGLVQAAGYEGQKWNWPSVAISPDRTRLARAGVIATASGPGKPGQVISSRYRFTAKLDVFEVAGMKRLWGVSLPQKVTSEEDVMRYVAHSRHFFTHDPWFADVRWSHDGRCLSYTLFNSPRTKDLSPECVVMDAATWQEVARIPRAANAFVSVPPTKGG